MSARKRRAILHIGVGKTGTTSIQARMKSAREELLRRGYCYPETWGPQHHSQLVQLMDPARRGGLDLEDLEEGELPPAESVAASVAAELARLPDHVHTVVYSSELLYGNSLTPGGVARLKAALDEHFDRYMVIVYIRRQDERAVSGYSTLLKDGRTWQDPLEVTDSKLRTLDYAECLAPWTDAFGLDSMLVRVFDRTQLLDSDVVADFLRVTGIGHFEAEDEEPVRNPSLSAPALEFLRRVNETAAAGKAKGGAKTRGFKSQRLRRILVNHFAGPGLLPSRDRARAFYAQFRDSNAEVLARYFPGRDSLFTEDFSRYPEVETRPTEAEVMEVATTVTIAFMRDLDRMSAVEHLRRAREAVAAGEIGRARSLFIKASEEGGERLSKEAQEGLAALPTDAEGAARLKWRLQKGGAKLRGPGRGGGGGGGAREEEEGEPASPEAGQAPPPDAGEPDGQTREDRAERRRRREEMREQQRLRRQAGGGGGGGGRRAAAGGEASD